MLRLRRLACSFCGKRAKDVAMLVAGRRAYICDRCVARASQIMGEHRDVPRSPQP